MNGINWIRVASILGTVTIRSILFSKTGAIRSIQQEILKYSVQKNIAMVKVTMRTLAQQNEQAYQEMLKTLKKHLTEEELKEILP